MSSQLPLNEILEGYAMATPEGNDPGVLREWISRYPEAEGDLLAFASERAAIRSGREKFGEEDKVSARLRGREAVDSVLSDISEPPAIVSLFRRAEDRGLGKQEFANTLGMTVSLVMLLEKRRVIADTVPARVVGAIASAIGSTMDEVFAYLRLPRPATSAAFKAEERPREIPRQDFREAVMTDPGLAEEQKRILLG